MTRAALADLLVSELKAREGLTVSPDDILAFDLMAYDVQPSCVSMVHSPSRQHAPSPPDDAIVVELERIGRLTNPVVAGW